MMKIQYRKLTYLIFLLDLLIRARGSLENSLLSIAFYCLLYAVIEGNIILFKFLFPKEQRTHKTQTTFTKPQFDFEAISDELCSEKELKQLELLKARLSRRK